MNYLVHGVCMCVLFIMTNHPLHPFLVPKSPGQGQLSSEMASVVIVVGAQRFIRCKAVVIN